MNEEYVKDLANNASDLIHGAPNLASIIFAKDFRLLTKEPIRIDDLLLEVEHLRVHQKSVADAGIESWGFVETIDSLSQIKNRAVHFVTYKGNGFAVKIYLCAERNVPIGVVVTRRESPSPAIKQSGETA